MPSTTLPGLNFDLGDTVDSLRDAIVDFADAEIAPRAAQVDSENLFPADLWKKLGDLGLHGMTVSEEYGGTQLGYLAHMVAMEEVSRASASVGLSYGAHSNLCVNQIHRNGSEAQKTKYLPKLVSGENVGALAMSEPNAGSDVVSMKLRAVKKGDRYVLNGSKMWITNSGSGNTILLLVKTDPTADPRHKGMSLLIAEKGPGFIVSKKLEKLGYKGIDSNALTFDDYRVPVDRLIGGIEGVGLKQVLGGLELGRINLAARGVGSWSSQSPILRYAVMWKIPMLVPAIRIVRILKRNGMLW